MSQIKLSLKGSCVCECVEEMLKNNVQILIVCVLLESPIPPTSLNLLDGIVRILENAACADGE